MNRMADVAKLFGKELGEEFEVYAEERGFCWVKFTENGFFMLNEKGGRIATRNDIENMEFCIDIEDLLTGEAVLIDDE